MRQKAEPDSLSDDPGTEYAPQMYHSIPYDPMSQTVSSDTVGGTQYNVNTNRLNPYMMNMREPAENTISREFTPYPYSKDEDSIASAMYPVVPAGAVPLDSVWSEKDSAMVLSKRAKHIFKECEGLYQRFCMHCHGEKLDGAGPISDQADPPGPFSGIANLMSGGMKKLSPGHIFHVITYGKGRMGSHASQLNEQERWRIIYYVKHKQGK